MDIRQIRKINFDHLLDAECEGVNRVMADRLGKEPSFISLYKNGRRNVGHALARLLEQKFGKESGWMDTHHGEGMNESGVAENRVVYSSKGERSSEEASIPVLESKDVKPFTSEGVAPADVKTIPCPYPKPELMRLYAWIDQSNTNAPLLPAGTIYTIMPMTVVKNGLLTAVTIQQQIAVGIYNTSPIGPATLSCGSQIYELPSDHAVIGKVMQITPPLI